MYCRKLTWRLVGLNTAERCPRCSLRSVWPKVELGNHHREATKLNKRKERKRREEPYQRHQERRIGSETVRNNDPALPSREEAA